MDAHGYRLVSRLAFPGGGTMGMALGDGRLYIGHKGPSDVATTIIDVRDPAHPHVTAQLPADPGTRSHKAAVAGGLLLQNCERVQVWQGPPFVTPVGGADRWTPGMRVFNLADPDNPQEISFFTMSGVGVHRMTFTELPLAYVTGSDEDYTDQFLLIVDLSDPAAPREIGRWWYPGMWVGGGERPRFPPNRRYALHHALRAGALLCCGWWDAGLVILDIADPTRPQLVANLNWGPGESGATHTALPLPGRDLLVVTDEAIVPGCADIPKRVRVLDIADPYSPRLLSVLPEPQGDFCRRGGRFGPHNLAEPRPNTAFDPNRLYVTYFNAGLRVYDLTDPRQPREVARFVPDPPRGRIVPQTDDVTVGLDGVVYLTDRDGGGLTILEPVARRGIASS